MHIPAKNKLITTRSPQLPSPQEAIYIGMVGSEIQALNSIRRCLTQDMPLNEKEVRRRKRHVEMT